MDGPAGGISSTRNDEISQCGLQVLSGRDDPGAVAHLTLA